MSDLETRVKDLEELVEDLLKLISALAGAIIDIKKVIE